jgi:hypothetical protein
MSDETILTSAPSADPKPSGEPNAQTNGDTGKPAEPAAPKPDGGTQEPTKAEDGEKKPTEDQAAKPAAPETPVSYAEFKVPEGIELEKENVEQFTTLAKELKLTQDQAQKFVDLQTALAQKTAQAALQQFEELKETWKHDTLKVLGKDAQKQLAFAATARNRFATEALSDYLEASGLGNHPAMVQFFISVGKAMSEDTFTEGKHRTATAKTAAEILYPTMNKST